ncbi:MAG: MBL fold metallo-hydrolase [Acidimicrobiales bacterium]
MPRPRSTGQPTPPGQPIAIGTGIPAPEYVDSSLEITRVVVGPLDNNVFVVRCRDQGEAVLIDAADEHRLLLALCRQLGVRRVIETHGHRDHIAAVPALRNAGYDVAIAAGDSEMLASYDSILEDDSVIEVGRLRLRIIHTPGHTPGSMCFWIEGSPLVFSGDTLFPGGPGSTRFSHSSFNQIIDSIETRLFGFADDTIIMPGHGRYTTIGSERPHLDEWVSRGW